MVGVSRQLNECFDVVRETMKAPVQLDKEGVEKSTGGMEKEKARELDRRIR